MCNGIGSTILMHEVLAKNLMVPAKPSSKSNQKSLIVIGFRLIQSHEAVATRERIYDVLDSNRQSTSSLDFLLQTIR